jgi:hypothetical protein
MGLGGLDKSRLPICGWPFDGFFFITPRHKSTLLSMGRTFGFIALVVVVGIGGYVYTNQTKALTPGGATPKTTINTTAVQNDLLAMANAERRYWATNAKYASLDELRRNGDISIPTRADYAYSADASDNTFTIIATYSGSDPQAPKRMAVDQTLVITTN